MNLEYHSKVVSARLSDDELVALNRLMQKHGCKNLSGLLRLVISGNAELGPRSSIVGDITEIKGTLSTIVNNLGVAREQKFNLIPINEVSSGGWTFRRELRSTPFEPPLCGYLTNLVMSPPG